MPHAKAMSKVGYDALMHEACVVWGFCGCIKQEQPMHVDLIIPPSGPVSADQFVEWLVLADNLNPNDGKWSQQKQALRAAFVKYMGAETVDASLLTWSNAPTDDSKPAEFFRGEIPDSE